MTNLPKLRKNIKFFANGKNAPLVKLSTMISDSEKVLAVIEIPHPSEYNTCLQVERDLFPLLPLTSGKVTKDKRFVQRNIVYNRMDLEEALRIEFAQDQDTFTIDEGTFYQQPITLSEFITTLNNKFGYDLTADDVTLTYTSGNNYTVTARPNSLMFTGQASINFGSESDTPPPVKVPSHDSVWENALINLDILASVNGNPVSLKNNLAMFNAGIALVQYKAPNVAWLIWTGSMVGEATITATDATATISVANVNQTLTKTDENLYAKYVPFVTNYNVPDFVNPITAVNFNKTMTFALSYTPTLNKLVTFWINDVVVPITDLVKESGSNGFKLVINQTTGEATLTHNGQADCRVSIRVNVPTLPALVRTNSRFIYGIQRGGVNIPLDQTGRELYHIFFPAKEIIIPDPSNITPVIPTNQADYVAALDKVNTGLVLPFSEYNKTNPVISTLPNGKLQLTANVESETHEARYPAFYFISQKDWDVISAQPIQTVLGTYSAATTPVTNINITVGLLLSSTVPVVGGRLLCIVSPLPSYFDASFRLNWQPGSEYYKETTTPLRFDIHYTKASIISPRPLDRTILREIAGVNMTNENFDLMYNRQLEVQRYMNQGGGEWFVNYEYNPPILPDVLVESLDDNGLYVIQLFAIPAAAMVQIQGIAARKPTAVILSLLDTITGTTTTMTAMEIIQSAVIQQGTGDGYIYHRMDKRIDATGIKWTFTCDYDESDFSYRQTSSVVNIVNSVIDLPQVPFQVGYQECSNETQFNSFKTIVQGFVAEPIFDWKEQKLIISDDSLSGQFIKYGIETTAKYTVGRLLLGTEQLDWIRNSDFSTSPITNPNILRIANTSTESSFDVNVNYLKANVGNVGGIPIPLPMFDDQESLVSWELEFNWYGFGNPPRPSPSSIPNLANGTIVTEVQNTIAPIQNIPSLFNFTASFNEQEKEVMRSKLIQSGKTIDAIETIVEQYEIAVLPDITIGIEDIGQNAQNFITNWGSKTTDHLVMEVIEIDRNLLTKFLTRTFTSEQLNTVVFTFTNYDQNTLSNDIDKVITVADIRARAVFNTEMAFIPIVGVIKPVQEFGNPIQLTQAWVADYSVLNLEDEKYDIRKLDIKTYVHLDNETPAQLTLKGIKDETFATDLNALVVLQWPELETGTVINTSNLDLTANNNFGLWNVGFLDKGKKGFVVLEFSENAYRLLLTAQELTPEQEVLSILAEVPDYVSQSASNTATQVLEKLNGGRLLTIPLDVLVRNGDYTYLIDISLNSDVTTSNTGPTVINNRTAVKDVTPADVVVDASWTLPADDTELAYWCSLVGLSSLTKSQYTVSTTQFNYIHNVTVDKSITEYVVAISVNKEVRERLVENQFDSELQIGTLGGSAITVGNLLSGVQDTNGNNILLVRAPVSIEVDNNYILAFDVPGIESYEQVFTGRDYPVVAASNVLITKIQTSMGQLIDNLRTALNPIADQIVTADDLSLAEISETDSIRNILNGVSRNNIGKKWVIPIGIDKTQLEVLKPGSWVTIVVQNPDATITVDTAQLNQFVSEGWSYLDSETGINYAVYPLIFDFTDSESVVKFNADLSAGVSVGRWSSWFTNYQKPIDFEYSINEAKQTFVEVLMPDQTLLNELEIAFETPNQYISVSSFNKTNLLGDVSVKVNDSLTSLDIGKRIPLFVRFLTSQLTNLDSSITLGVIKRTLFNKNQAGVYEPGFDDSTSFTKLAIESGKTIGEYTYLAIGEFYNSTDPMAYTYQATFDYDEVGKDWLSGQSVSGFIVEFGYDVSCEGAINYAGELDITITAGTVLVANDGSRTVVENEDQFLGVLQGVFGLRALVITPYAV